MDYFKFDLQLFADTTFPAGGYYTVDESGVVTTTTVGTDGTPTSEGTYLHIAGDTWTIGVYAESEYKEEGIAALEKNITLAGLVGTAEATKTVTVPASIGNLGDTYKVVCTGVGNYVSVSGLADDATVTTAAITEIVANAAITVNGVAFTGIKSPAAGNVTFTVNVEVVEEQNVEKVSATLGADEAAVTVAKAGVDVVAGGYTYTTKSADAVSIKNFNGALGELTAGSLDIGENVAIRTTVGGITNNAEAAITVASDGAVTPLEAPEVVNYLVTLFNGKEIEVGEGENKYTYKGAADAAVAVTRGEEEETLSYALTAGTVTVDKGKKTLADGNIIENVATEDTNNAITVNYNGDITEIAENGVAKVIIPVNGDSSSTVTIGSTVYTNADAPEEGEAKKTATIKTVGTDGTKAELIEGAVSVSANGVEITLGDAKITNSGAGELIVDDTNGVTKAVAGCSINLGTAGGTSVMIDGKEYTNADDAQATITVATVETKLVATLTDGAVVLGAGAKVIAEDAENINSVANNSTTATITVTSDGTITEGASADYTVEIKAEKTVTLGGTEYTTPEGQTAEIQVVKTTTSETPAYVTTLVKGTVVVAPEGQIKTAIGTVTNNDTTEGHTITVTAAGVVTPTTYPADYNIALNDDAKVTINSKEYSGSANAVIHVTKADAEAASVVTLTGGSIKLGKDAAVITDIGTITNTVEDAITVAKAGTVTAAKEKAANYTIALVAGETGVVTVDSKTYKNSGGAVVTVTKAAGTDALVGTLTAGKVSVAKDATVHTSIGNFTNKGEAALVVAANGTVDNDPANEESYEFLLDAGKSITINGHTYTGDKNAKVEVTKAAESSDPVETLTAGTVSVAQNGVIKTNNATFTNLGANAIVVNSESVATNVTANSESYTIALDAVAEEATKKAVVIDDATYTQSGNVATTIAVTKAATKDPLVKTLSAGAVTLGEGADVVAAATTFANKGAATITVDDAGKVSGLTTGLFTAKGTGAELTYAVSAGDTVESKATLDIYVVGGRIGAYNNVVAENANITFDAGVGTVKVGDEAQTAEEVTLNYVAGKNFYALIVNSDGTLSTVACSTAKEARNYSGAIGYFECNTATEGTATFTFHQANQEGTAAKAIGAVTINAAALTEDAAKNPLKTVVVSDITVEANKVKLTNIAPTVDTVTGTTDYAYEAKNVLVTGSSITLGTETETAYYVLSNPTEDHGRTKYTLADKVTADPGDANYIMVVTTKKGTGEPAAEKNTVAISYHTATTGGVALDPESVLGIVATAAAEDAAITVNDGIRNTITGAKGGVSAATSGTGTQATLSYTTTFEWTAGTYFVPVASGTTLKTEDAAAVDTDPTKSYNKVVVTVEGGVTKAVVSAVTGDLMTTPATSDVTAIVIAAGDGVTKFDASDSTLDGVYITAAENVGVTFDAGETKAYYTAATATAKIDKTGDVVTLSEGSVTMDKGLEVLTTVGGKDVVIKNAAADTAESPSTITVSSAGAVTAIATNGVAEVGIEALGTATIGAYDYKNEGESDAVLTATASLTKLTKGTVSMDDADAAIGWVSGTDENAKTAVVTNTTAKKVTVDAANGVTAIEAEGGASVNLGTSKDTAIKVLGKEYKNAADAQATVVLAPGAEEGELAAALNAGTVTLGEGAAITANGHAVENTGSTLTIASTGVISALAGGEAFKVGTGKTYTVGAVSGGKADIVVTGDRIGVYNDVTLDGATVTLASEVDTVTAKKTTETPEAISAEEVSLAYTAGKSYYALVNTSGALTTTACDSAEAAQKVTNAIGYFKFTAAGSGQTVTFHDVDGKYVSEVWQEGTQKQAIGVVNIDALNMTEGATGTPLTTIAVGDVSVNGVKLTNVVDTVTTVTGTDDENWAYKTIALLADDESISLDQTAGTKYYALSVQSTTKGKSVYTVADSPITEPTESDLANNNYIVVTTSEDKKSIGVSYHTATAEGKGVALDKTSVLDVVANGAVNDATVTFTDGITHEVTSGSNGVKVVDSAGLTTISYITTFAWADGTYFAALDTSDITVGLVCTTDPTDEDGYNKLVVTSSGEGDNKVYAVKVEGVQGKTMTTSVDPDVTSIAVSGGDVKKVNASDSSVLGAEIVAGANIGVTFDGTNYYTAKDGNATVKYDQYSKLANLVAGSVEVPASAKFEVGDYEWGYVTTYKNETMSGEPAAAAAAVFTANGSFNTLAFAKGIAVTVVDGDYAGTKIENTSASAGNVTLTNGAVTDVSNTGACTVTIASEAGKAAEVLGVVYTNTASTAAGLTVSGSAVKLTSGVVTLNGDGVAASLSVGDDYTITHTTTELKTVTVSSTGEVTAIRKGATVSVGTTTASAEKPVTITIGDNEYTMKAATTFTATALDHVALTTGSLELAKGASIIANGTLFTNSADTAIAVTHLGVVTGVDAGAAFSAAADETGAAPATYTVSAGSADGKLDIVVAGDKVGVYDEVTKASMTVQFANGVSTILEGVEPKKASAVTVTCDGTHNVYALVNDGGTLTAVGVADAAAAVKTESAIGYFKFAADGTKETVSFYNMNGKQAVALGDVTIDAEKLEGITAIDVTGVSAGTMKLNNLAAGAAVTGTEEANCTWLTSYVLDDNQTITVGSGAATTYYTVNAAEADAKGVRTCTLTNAGSAEPAATVNYFKVVTTADGATTISYTQATEGTTKAEFSDASTLLVDATGAANGAAITVDDSVATKNVVSADENGATVSGGTTTISYTTTFAWAAGTYFTGIGDTTLEVGDTVTTDPTNTSGYNKVVVTLADGVYKAVISGAKGSTMTTAVTPTITRVNLSETVTKFDATDDSVKGMQINAGVANTEVILGASDADTRVVGMGVVKITRGTTTKTYTATDAVSGAITLQDDKARKGTFALSAAAGATETLDVWVKSHKVGDLDNVTITGTAASNVTVEVVRPMLDDGTYRSSISSVTGLGAGETLTCVRYEDTDDDEGTAPEAVTYTFTYDSTGKFITRESSTGDKAYYMVGEATVEDLDLVALSDNNLFDEPVMADAAFNWRPGTYYFSLENGVEKLTGEGEPVEANTPYIEAVVDYDGEISSLHTVVGTAAGTVAVDAQESTRTIKVDASGVAKITYNKDGYWVDAYIDEYGNWHNDEFVADETVAKVALTNVGKNSVIYGLDDGDTMTTVDLKKGDLVTVGVNNEAHPDESADYVAAADGALSFKGAALAGGTVTMINGTLWKDVDGIPHIDPVSYAIADGTTATLTTTGVKVISAVVTVATDDKGTKATSITGLAEGDKISFTKDANNGTTYAIQADNVVWKTVEVDGVETVYVKKMANAGDDVVAEDAEGDNKYVAGTINNQTFNWAAGTANFLVRDVLDGEGNVTGTEVEIVPGATSISYEDVGAKFVKLAVAESGALTMTEGTVTWKGEVTETAAISGAAYDVEMTLPADKAVKLTTRPATSGAFTITNAAGGSELFALGAKDSLSTASLNAGDTIKLGETTYKASAGTAFSFVGGQMTDGAVELNQTTKTVALADGSTVTVSEAEGHAVAVAVSTAGDPAVTAIESITGLDVGETVTIAKEDGTTIEYAYDAKGKKVQKTVTTEGGKPVTKDLVIEGEPSTSNLLEAKEVATAAFAWPDEGQTTTFYRLFTGSPKTTTVAAGDPADLNVAKGDFVVEATVKMGTGTAAPIEIAMTTKKYNGVEYVDVTDEEAADNNFTINLDGTGTDEKISYTNGTNKAKVVATNIAAGSVFTDLVKGSTVQTGSIAEKATITVNGQVFTAAMATQIKAYAAEEGANIVTGAITVTDTVTSSTDAGENVESLTVEGGNGVQASYTNGSLTSITGLDKGETVTYVDADGNAKVYACDAETGAITVEDTNLSAGTRLTADLTLEKSGDLLHPKKTTITMAEVYSGLTWPKEGETAAAYAVYGESVTIGTEGEWAPVKDGEAEATTFVKAYVAVNGVLTLTKVKSNTGTSLPDPVGAFSDKETVTVDVNGGKVTLESAGKGALKGVTLNNIGAGSNVLATGWTENDKVTTTALKVTTDEETGAVTAREQVTVGGKTFKAGENGTTLSIKGYVDKYDDTQVAVESGTLWLDKDFPNNYFKAQSGSGAMSDITYNKYDGDNAGVAVTVVGGKVTSIKGLDVKREEYDTGEGGTVKITTEDGASVQYQAKRVSEYDSAKGEWVYKNVIERTDSIGNTATTALTDSSVNVVEIPEEKWTYSEIGTLQDFNWNGTGYFEVQTVYYPETTKYASVETQSGGNKINKSDEGEIYLKVVATKDSSSGAVTISEMSYVQVQSNGELKTVSSALDKINIDATGLKGVTLPKHTEKVVIENVTGGTFVGLNDEDLITGEKTGTVSIEKTVGKKTVTTDFVVAAAENFEITGAGTITAGVFTVADEAAGSAVLDATVNTTAAREIKVTGGDGVKVTFLSGEITSVQDMEDGETATITSYQYTAKGDKAYETTIITKSGSTVTKTIKDSAYPVDIVMTSTTATADTDVFGLKTFKMKSAFDFSNSKTTAALGLFEITGVTVDEYSGDAYDGKAIVGPQTESEVPAAFGDTDKYYVMVGAGKKSGTYTVNYAQVFHYDKDEAALLPVESYALSGGMTVTAPTDGNLTIASDAFKLKDGETERDYAINVAGAQVGKSYIGLGEDDTVTASLTANQFITVGATAKTTKKLTAAADGEVVVNGEGKAYTGTFMVTTAGFEAYNGATTTKLTGNSSKAVAVVAKGAVTSLKNLEVGKSVTITKTTAAGAVSSETYKAEKGSGDALKITRTTVAADGFTEVKIGYAPTGTELIDDSIYTETAKTEINSTFNWAAGGYFAVTTDANGAFSSAAVKPGTTKITTKEAGNLYLKADNSTGNWVFTLQEAAVDETTGLLEMKDVAWTTKTKGTLSVEAPAEKALYFDRKASTLPDGVALTITGIACEHDEDGNLIDQSSITNLQDGDVVSSANLVKDDYVDINGKGYSIAAADALKVTISDYQPILSDGTISVYGDTVKTTAGSFTVTGSADVKVLDGKVMGISGLTGVETVAFTDANNNVATYNADGVIFTTFANGSYITTMAMAEGADVNGANYTAGGGVLKFYNAGTTLVPDAQLVDGTVKLDGQGDAVTLKGGTAVTLTTGADNPDVKVTVANGVVTSITGLQAGEVITAGTTTYAVDANAPTLVTKTVGGVTVTGFLSKNGGDVLSARYLEANPDIDISDPENAFEGQLSWGDVSGRSTGYFEVTVKETKTSVTKTAKAIAEQTTKTVVGDKLKAGQSQIYVVANTVTNENNGAQTLNIGAIQATNNGTKTVISSADAATLLNGASLSVTAPATAITLENGNSVVPRLLYTKTVADKYKIAINKVARNSRINGLTSGDTATTATLEIDNSVWMGGNRYMAGAKGTMEFLGEGDASANTARTTMKTGTLKLINGANVLLSGSKDGAVADIVVSFDDNGGGEQPVVKVANGVVTSITGLKTEDATVTLAQEGIATVTYTVLNTEATAWNTAGIATAWTTMVERKEVTSAGTKKTYASFATTKNIYATSSTSTKTGVYSVTNGYKDVAADTEVGTDKLYTVHTDTKGKVAAYTVYVAAWANAQTKKAWNVGNLAQTGEGEAAGNKIVGTDTTNRGNYYIAATVKTDATTGLTTIQKLEAAQVDATGKPAVLKGWTVERATIDGALIAGGAAKLSYAIPKATTVIIENAAVGSVFTGIKATDTIDSAATGEAGYTLTTKGVVVYNVGDVGQETRTVTYKAGTKEATYAKIVTDDDGVITSLTGLDAKNETVTIVEKTANDDEVGAVTTVYAVSKDGLTVTKTVTAADGAVTVTTANAKTAAYDWIADEEGLLDKDKVADRKVVSDFDWTLQKNSVGYFAATTAKGKTSATVKAGKATLNPYTKKGKSEVANTASYLAVQISDDGVLESISQMRFDRSGDAESNPTYNTLVPYGAKDGEAKFKGVINVAAPTGKALTFDRAKLDAATIDLEQTGDVENTNVAITGAVAGSEIESLVTGDTVKTATLKAAVYKNGVLQTAAQSVKVNDTWFKAGSNSALSFLVQKVNDEAQTTVTGGTIILDSNDVVGGLSAYIGTKLITAVDTPDGVTVTASTNNKGVTTYTVGDLEEGETFTVNDFSGTVRTYRKTVSALFCEAKTGSDTVTTVYNLGTKTSVTSAILDKAVLPDNKTWFTCDSGTLTFQATTDSGLKLVSGKAVTVDLATLDKRIAADEKAAVAAGAAAGSFMGTGRTYDFVIDQYVSNPAKFAGAASVINNANYQENLQQIVGDVVFGGMYDTTAKKYTNLVFTANANVGQTIKAADTWTVNGSAFADSITGAAKGKDTLNGGAGNDTLTGGAANDTFEFGAADGRDVVKSYATGKDRIELAGFDFDNVNLVAGMSGKNTADVLLHDGTGAADDHSDAANSVLLAGMGNGKAVTIGTGVGVGDDKTYFFGNAASAKGMTFSYVEGAYYLGKAGTTTANTLSVKTDSKKAAAKALGDNVEIDLTDETHYKNINAIDGSKSANAMILTAATDGSTLKGGTYQSILKAGAGADSLVGGSGEDVFWFDTVEKADAVSGYASGKDMVWVGGADGATATEINGLTIQAGGSAGTDVILGNGETGSVTLQKAANAAKAITFRADEDGNTLTYYVGSSKAKAKNNFTATYGTDAVKDEESVDKTVDLKSYYVGSNVATDTLAIKTAKGDKTAVAAKFSLADMANHLSSIDVLDTSGINIAGSSVTLQGAASGTFTLKGTAGTKNVTDRFNLTNLEAGANQITLTNLDVLEVIELAAGMKLEGAGNTWSITDEAGTTSYGTITLTGATKNAAFTKGSTASGNVTYTRTTK